MAASARRPPGRPRLSDTTVPTTDQIVQVAGDLFMRRGYRAVTVEMVAGRAGLTKAAVYYHFADKAALLSEALVSLFGRVRATAERILCGPGCLSDRLVTFAETVLALPDPLMRFEILLREAREDLSAAQLSAIRAAEDNASDVVVAAMRAGIESGELRGLDPALLGHAYLALLFIGQSRAPDGGLRFPDHHKSAHALVDLLWNGVAGGEAPPATSSSAAGA